MGKDELSEHQLRGWIAVSASGSRGKDSRQRSDLSDTGMFRLGSRAARPWRGSGRGAATSFSQAERACKYDRGSLIIDMFRDPLSRGPLKNTHTHT